MTTDDSALPLPDRLRDLFVSWDAAGRQPQRAMRWNRSTWQATLPDHHDLLAELPDQIDRDVVAERGRRAGESEAEAVQAFVSAMVWGYGPIGYGAFRTARVLRENPDAPGVLLEAALRVRRDGGAEALAWLKANRLRYLGVAFATKYLFFCSGNEAPALVLDRLVQRWLWRHAACSVSLNWQVGHYRRYLVLLTGWADELGITPGQAEWLIFADSASQELGSPWASPLATADSSDDTACAETAVLEALDEALAAYVALGPDVEPSDVEDFELGVRQLRRIVLARGFTHRGPSN
ncbi:8-oxoguanine DNA glycosylase OGG fold protein [Micromonospora sp. CPCC 205556]|uniref:8-oxoguanine DNA glycosylase OGG fold protein n=1 Tax=Micromonospora sp. CPCC 205556 TaxID=3122398 RepID=UPI002FF3C490